MNKSQAKKKVFDYFKENAIEYKFVNEELKLIDVDSLDTIYLCSRSYRWSHRNLYSF